MAHILITGGAGFIGSRLALKLIDEGHAVTVLDTLSPQVHGANPEASPLFSHIRGKVRFVKGSVTDRAAMADVLKGQDAIVHLAAETGTGQSMYQIERYSAVNIGGTALMLDILANEPHAVKRIVVASSRSIYGEGRYRSAELGDVFPGARAASDMERGDFEVKYAGATTPLQLVATDEMSKIHPASVYGITKQVQEQLVMTVCPSIKIEGVALRYQNVFGPGQSLSNPYTGILSIFSNLMMQGRPINIFEDGTESRDFVYIDDVVDATALAITHPLAANEVFNVGTGVPVSVLTVAETLKRLIGIDVPINISGNFRIGDIRHNYAAIDKIATLLDFRPAYRFERGIAEFVGWATEVGATASGYELSLDEMRAKGLLK